MPRCFIEVPCGGGGGGFPVGPLLWLLMIAGAISLLFPKSDAQASTPVPSKNTVQVVTSPKPAKSKKRSRDAAPVARREEAPEYVPAPDNNRGSADGHQTEAGEAPDLSRGVQEGQDEPARNESVEPDLGRGVSEDES
jgi:hypothetical protein